MFYHLHRSIWACGKSASALRLPARPRQRKLQAVYAFTSGSDPVNKKGATVSSLSIVHMCMCSNEEGAADLQLVSFWAQPLVKTRFKFDDWWFLPAESEECVSRVSNMSNWQRDFPAPANVPVALNRPVVVNRNHHIEESLDREQLHPSQPTKPHSTERCCLSASDPLY